MSKTAENPDCRMPVNLILAAAHRLFAYDKIPLALALIQVVLEQYPENSRARLLHETVIGMAPAYPVHQMHRMFYDPVSRMFFVGEKGGKGNIPFETLEEAEKYLRDLK